jgi:hypothetical protein
VGVATGEEETALWRSRGVRLQGLSDPRHLAARNVGPPFGPRPG